MSIDFLDPTLQPPDKLGIQSIEGAPTAGMADKQLEASSFAVEMARPDGAGDDGETAAMAKQLADIQEQIDNPADMPDQSTWLQRAKEAWDASDDFFTQYVRGDLADSLDIYHNRHPSSSPYVTNENPYSSKVFRPKPRTAMNKQESDAAVAFFSNPDLVSSEAENPYDKVQVQSAEIAKKMLNYHLDKNLKKLHVFLGGFQDTMVQGCAVGKVHWNNKKNKPKVDLIKLENCRWDPASDWTDIVGSSPYFIVIHDMFVGDVKSKISSGEFDTAVDDSQYWAATSLGSDEEATRRLRNKGADPQDKPRTINNYQIVKVLEFIMRWDDVDYHFWTLGTVAMLKQPVLLTKSYRHGRPFVVGSNHIETHTTYPESDSMQYAPMSAEINEVANQYLNNLKMVMSPKFLIKSDSDIAASEQVQDALVVNMPGVSIYTENPKEDCVPLPVGDVTGSVQSAMDRLDRDFDDLAGLLPAATNVQGHSPTETARGMQMLNTEANVLTETKLKCYAITFMEPIIQMLLEVIRFNETSKHVLALVGALANPQQQQNGGLAQITQAAMPPGMAGGQPMQQPQQPAQPAQPETHPMGAPTLQPGTKGYNALQVRYFLEQPVNVKINLGLNATDPALKLQKLAMAKGMLVDILKDPIARIAFDVDEFAKEVWALCGYGVGEKFMNRQQNPVVTALQQQVQQLMMAVKMQQAKEQTKVQVTQMKEQGANLRKAAEISQDERELEIQGHQFLAQHSHEREQAANQAQEQQQPPLAA